ncbi:alpha/beta fold hydrolase [Xanthomonas sp. AmX2]|uniref:alpha/beta fold hydrolase n=1 Tax=Xanthomonas sp. TaxID=29446 RepID=UPI00197D37C6|nr:alpha/beta hydrolase [Xanthomonas sp.]MBN6151103.1 alpha/beta fold hydrolase [Xanthomonas sp.]
MVAVARKKRTTVRFLDEVRLQCLRLAFGIGGWVLPQRTGRHVERLFTRPLRDSRERALAAPLHGAELDSLQIDGETVALYRWGDPATQPLLLFSHGWSSFGLRVLPWLPRLRAQGYAVVSFDQIAHGRSSGRHATLPGFGRVLAEVARRQGPLHGVIGHSLGAAAIVLALAEGVHARRVVLVAPPADALAATDRFAGLLGLGRPALPAFHRAVEARAGVSFAAVAAQHIGPGLATPALVVHDLADGEVPWDEGERYARYWPGARLLNTVGLGHHRIVGDAGVIDAGLRFLRGEAVGERVFSTAELPYGLA